MPDGHPVRVIHILAERSCTAVTVTGGLVPRSLRHLLAVAVAILALSTAAVPAFAADEPVLTGTIVKADGTPFPIEVARMTMTGPDGGGIHAEVIEPGVDGSFEVVLMPWGTAEAPAEVRITVTGAGTESVPNAAGCVDEVAHVADATFEVALQDGGEPQPVQVVAEAQIVGTVCGAQATPGTTLPPSGVSPVTPAPSAAPAAPVAPIADTEGSPPWLPLLLLAVVAVAAILGAWRVLAGRTRG